MDKYDHKKIEPKWQKYWEKNELDKAVDNDKRPKFYGLIEFPYPSGVGLHVGHIRSNTAMDIICRKRRMQGYNVLYPIGWDAFGLPTENYAIKTGIHPIKVTKENTDIFRRQLKNLGFSFDWNREINTTDPEYYKWTQWIFLQFLKRGLAYKKKMAINWCPKDKIGLANEEVIDGCCERCGTPVEKREKEQWMLAITKYADRLDRDLDPKKILIGTRNTAKVQMIKACLVGVKGLELVSLNDLPAIDDGTLVEGDDFKENARLKSQFYFQKTGIPTISTDHILWIEKWPENNGFMIHLRKHANPKSQRATDEEVIIFLKNFLKTVGGKSKANFHYAMAYTDEKGTIETDAVPYHGYILQTEEAMEHWPGYPTEALLKDEKTGLYKSEQSDEVKYNRIRQVLVDKFLPRMLVGSTPIDYQEKIKIQQKNWIGRKEGINITYPIDGSNKTITVFTTRPDTNYGATFVVLAPENELAREIVTEEKKRAASEYIKKSQSKSEEERIAEGRKKTGVFTGRYAVNHLTGKKMPIWISDFVLAGFGTGAVVGVPGHDVRDFEFAQEFGLEIIRVVVGKDKDTSPITRPEQVQEDEGRMINSDILNGLEIHEATQKIMDYMEEKGWGKQVITYHLRDWVFSRQRYWGEPIPVVFCQNCKKLKPRLLLIHGLGSTPDEHWFPWLKAEMEKRGYEVFAPHLPDENNPKLKDWIKSLKQLKLDNGAPIYILGHSLGAAAACRFIAQSKITVRKLILVAPIGKRADWSHLKEQDFTNDEISAIKNFSDGINLAAVKQLVDQTVLYISPEDPYIPMDIQNSYRDLSPQVHILHGKAHFTGEQAEFQEVMEEFSDNLNLGVVPVPEKDLPVELPEVKNYQPTDTGESPLAAMTDWVKTKCPRCGGPAKRETDTMPNWAGSSWYYLRYTDPKNKKEFADYKKIKYWTPVDWYNGGMEHTTLHLLYSRFWHKFLFDLGLVPTNEPYAKRTSHGMILAEGGVKMSKSKGNSINPDDIVKSYGADALRIYEMFMGPFDQTIAWNTDGLAGAQWFLEKIWNFYGKVKLFDCGGAECNKAPDGLPELMHKTIKKVTEDIETMKFNTAISQMMIFMNFAGKLDSIPRAAVEKFLIILSPFAPHLAEELWEKLGHKKSIFKETWPAYDPKLAKDEIINLVIQVNGKVRDTVEVDANISEEEAKKLALENEKVKKWLEGKEVKKVIFVKGRLVNIVVK